MVIPSAKLLGWIESPERHWIAIGKESRALRPWGWLIHSQWAGWLWIGLALKGLVESKRSAVLFWLL
jgi:hypothetical protein